MQNSVREFIDKHDMHTDTYIRFIDLASEVGELGKEIIKGGGYGKHAYANTASFADEVGDCLFSLLALCCESGVDAKSALRAALDKYAARLACKGSADSGA